MDHESSGRAGALAAAARLFDKGRLKEVLSGLVAFRSTSQEPGFEAECERYLAEGIRPWLERLGFTVGIHPNPLPGFGPILAGIRIEDPARPCPTQWAGLWMARPCRAQAPTQRSRRDH